MDFESVQLGRIFQRYGGGGHQRVASVLVPEPRAGEAREILAKIVADIRHDG
jgi:nanoRNase/pAp phosphatase (c-di-AMP/oligoRNAs hydrolase)